MRITPRPEFGKPETGMVRHWFRTDAQMRRNYMTPEEREVERQRISERRRLAKQWRAESEKQRERNRHGHFSCRECSGGLHDVGIYNGASDPVPSPDPMRLCCTCLRTVPTKTTRALVPGPNHAMFRCRVLDPDPPAETEAESVVAQW